MLGVYPEVYPGGIYLSPKGNPGGIYLSPKVTRVVIVHFRVYPGGNSTLLGIPGGIYLSPLLFPGGIYLSPLVNSSYPGVIPVSLLVVIPTRLSPVIPVSLLVDIPLPVFNSRFTVG